MTCRSAALLHLAGVGLAEGGGLPRGGSSSLGGCRFLVAAPEAGDEGDLLLVAHGRRAGARAGLRRGLRGRAGGGREREPLGGGWGQLRSTPTACHPPPYPALGQPQLPLPPHRAGPPSAHRGGRAHVQLPSLRKQGWGACFGLPPSLPGPRALFKAGPNTQKPKLSSTSTARVSPPPSCNFLAAKFRLKIPATPVVPFAWHSGRNPLRKQWE